MKETRQIILTRGIQGSGKSFWAKNWVKEKPEERIRFNNDDIRNMLGVYWVPSREKLVKDLKIQTLSSAMQKGYDIVVDNMNLGESEPAFYKKLIEEFNKAADTIEDHPQYRYSIEYKDFWTPLAVCIERDSKRENPIGAEVIKATYKRHISEICKLRNMEILKNYTSNENPTYPKAIIVDMDGTLSLNCTGRPFYGAEAANSIKDDIAIPSMVELLHSIDMTRDDLSILIVTGRENTPEVREATTKWLASNNIPYDKLYMRYVGDYRKASIVKNELYDTIIAPTYHTIAVFDDDTECINMWRNNGLMALQINN